MKLNKSFLILIIVATSILWDCSERTNPMKPDTPIHLNLTLISTNITSSSMNTDSIHVEYQSNRDSTVFFFKIDTGEWVQQSIGSYSKTNLIIGNHSLYAKGVLANGRDSSQDTLNFEILTKATYIKLPTNGYGISQMYMLNGYIYALVNSEPVRFFKINSANINEVKSISLPFRQDAKSQFCYSKTTNKFYMFYGSSFEIYIGEIDPNDMTYNKEFVKDQTDGLLMGTIATDDSSLYLISSRFVSRKWTGALIRKYSTNTPSDSPSIAIQLDSIYSKARSSQFFNGNLYLVGSFDSVSSYIAKVSSDLKTIDYKTISNKSVSDNSTIFGGSIFFGFNGSIDNKGTVVQLEPNSFTIDYVSSLSMPCMGLNSDSTNVFAILNSQRGILAKIKAGKPIYKYTLEYAQPSVVCSNGDKVFVTFNMDSTIVQSLDVRYLNSRILP